MKLLLPILVDRAKMKQGFMLARRERPAYPASGSVRAGRLGIQFLVKRLNCWHLLVLAFMIANASAQTAMPTGEGSYASGIPSAYQYLGGYYSMTAQQVVNDYTNLHMAGSCTNRPIPSNKWWTDTLVGDRSYQSTNFPPRTLVQDPYGGQLWAYPAMVAPNATGFDLYFPNSWTPSGSEPAMPQGAFMTGPALPITASVPPTIGSNDVLIADFDETAYSPGWVTTGTAFGTGPLAGGTWAGELPVLDGYLGNACVNSYFGGADAPIGTLTSPMFTIQKHYLHLLVAGGNNTNNTAVKLLLGTNVIYAAAGQQDGIMRWTTWNVSAYLGQTNAQIKLVDNATCCWGFIACSWIVASDDGSSPAARYNGTFTPLNSEVTDWSDWGVQFGLPDAQGRRADLTLARGVPFVWTTWTGIKPQIGYGAATLYGTNGGVIATNGGSFTNLAFAFDYQGRSFGIFAPDQTVFILTNGTLEAELAGTNNYLVYGLLPAHTNLAEFAQYAFARVTNTTYAWDYQVSNGGVTTTWNLAAQPLQGNQTNTLQGWLPHHYRTTSNALAFKPFTYLTPRGVMKVAAGNRFQISFNFRGLAPVLPAPHTNLVPNDYIASRMTNFLLSFAAIYPYNVGDTYGAGKNFALTAQYMSFAHQLGMTNQEAQLASGLQSLLTNWFTYTPGESNSFFAWYGNWRALIGFPAGYGSEAFNDNHFHYGYFMDAAALLGMENTNFLSQYGALAKLVAKEYANWDRTDTNFPFFRTFDIWEGHSWAGGFSSASGENQESSSEAMNSWVGLFLLGNQLGDSAMTAAGAMGYAVESTAVNEYWQDMYRTNFPASYGKAGVGIVGSGGLTYGTFFSGDPAWIYGIQWVPANHWNNYLCRDQVFANWQLTNLWNERIIASEYGINGFTLADANNTVAQGEYLGNYLLGFQTLFDADDVAALFDAAYATNAAIATGPNYSGATYYLTHSLRGLGSQDLNYFTSIPTSQVYFNPRTGRRTYVIYNPLPTNQTATVYDLGVAVDTLVVPAGTLIASPPSTTNQPVLSLQAGAQISWPTSSGDAYQLQWGSGLIWNSYGSQLAGTGASNSVFDASDFALRKHYRVQDISANAQASIAVNGGFESGVGASASGWSQVGSQPPVRVSGTAHGGTCAMQIFVTNSATTPNNSELDENLVAAGGSAVVAGTAYNLSFWAESLASGPAYVQNYGLAWLNSSQAQVGFVGWTSFASGSGGWLQIQATNLVAPASAVNAEIRIYGVTGAVAGGNGGSLIDDVAFLPTATIAQTNFVSPTVLPGTQLSWTSESGYTYQAQAVGALGASGGWSNLVAAPGNGGTQTWFNANGANQQLFYRLLRIH